MEEDIGLRHGTRIVGLFVVSALPWCFQFHFVLCKRKPLHNGELLEDRARREL